MNILVVEPLLTLPSSHQYKPKEQFYDEDRELLKKIPLSVVYKDDDFIESIISLDDFGNSTNDLCVRAHYSSPNLGSEYSIDLFNNAAILSAKHFVSTYDDIALKVYFQRPTSNLMICSDISKSPTLRLQCINLAKKCDITIETMTTVSSSMGLGEEMIKLGFWGLSACISVGKRRI